MKKIITIFLSFFVLIGFSQEKTKQQIKQEQKAAKEKVIVALLESKKFEFVADMAYPQGMRSISMISNSNFFRVQNDSIHSEMPFFGRAYSGAGYGGSGGGGLDFKGVAKDYSLVKDKKAYKIKADVKDNTDLYTIILTVFFEGNANLVINSSNRSSISYKGTIEVIK